MKHLILCLFILLKSQAMAQEASKEKIQKAIAFEQLQHPYLLFDKTGMEKIRESIETDAESRQIRDRLLAECNMLIHQPVNSDIPEWPENHRAGWTKTDVEGLYSGKLGSYTSNATKLAFAYQLTGDKQYAEKAYEFVEVVCKMPFWIYQAHEFDIIYSRVWPWNVDDNQVNFNVDIATASRGQAVAWVYDWIYNALDKSQRDRIRGALLEKVITPVRGDYDFHWWATSYRCNWTAVCNGGVGMVAMALIKDYPQLADVVAESYNRINLMMNELGVDGGWQEGGSYWSYGMDRALLFGHALNRLTDRKFNLFKNQRFLDNPATFPIYLYITPGSAVDFGDSGSRRIGGTDFFNLLVSETRNPEAAWYRNEVLGAGRSFLDLIFPRSDVEAKEPARKSIHFRTIDWWVMRSDFTNTDHMILAGKAGKNDDPHHGHLDIGHVSLYWKGEAFLKDSGKPYYDEKYFDELRWQYPQASSAGHNTILINGEKQIPGKLKDQPFDYEIGGKVLDFETSDRFDQVVMDASSAYPGKELKSWKRYVRFEKPDIALIFDDIACIKPNAKVEVRYHSGVDVAKDNQIVLLEGEAGTLAMIPFTKESFNIIEGQHAYQPIHGQKEFQWLPYFDIEFTSDFNNTSVGCLILPVENMAEAREIKKTLTFQISKAQVKSNFVYRNQPRSIAFGLTSGR